MRPFMYFKLQILETLDWTNQFRETTSISYNLQKMSSKLLLFNLETSNKRTFS